MPFESLQQLLSWKPPPIIQYVGHSILLAESKLCIFGGPKMFKSLAAQQLGFCIASGTNWLGFGTVQAKVMYLQSEVSKPAFRDRVDKMARNVIVPNNQYMFNTDFSFKLDRNSNVAELEKDIAKYQPQVLILDPWYKMMTVEENSAYSRTQDTLDYFISKYKLCVVMIHHDTVPMMDLQTHQPVTRFHPRGPRTTEGWFDGIIQIDGDVMGDDRILRFELRHGLSLVPPLPVTLDRSSLWLSRIP
jgi:hypothetical protein